MKLIPILFIFCLVSSLVSCKKQTSAKAKIALHHSAEKISYADGFVIYKSENYTKLQVNKPWPNAVDTLTYYFVPKNKVIPETIKNQKIIRTPVERVLVTSTTDIPLLEALGVERTLVGFPEPKYISAKKTRKRIDAGQIKNVGNLLNLNTELILDLQPELIVGFSSNANVKAFDLFERSGITTVMNGSWLESHPLGRAEWIKVFGYLFDKEKEAISYFNSIEKNYLEGKKLAQAITQKPTILSGNMYKDVWYVPGGNSYAAKLIHDAGGDYLWKTDTNTGSLALNFESVYDKAQHAAIWIGGGNFTSTKALGNFEEKYTLFDAYSQQQIFSKDIKKGATGGILYYEQGSLRADWVLLDLIKIFHPNLVPNHQFHFYQKLE
ncbi:ABC transporter substrate-binding protein [Aquimarina agarilytica]|uniref:ABC transporter substrate-binding protein n=1 Tax=Aquimarina agarilytica TaxID=1087449 RepID=UPI00028982CF|nr:ABC transporter substrate-binding protein [Aquimarina agarilytica]